MKKMFIKKSKSIKRKLIIIISISIIILIDSKINFLKKERNRLSEFILTNISYFKKKTKKFFIQTKNFFETKNLILENKNLKKELFIKNIEAILNKQVEKENKNLKNLLNLKLNKTKIIYTQIISTIKSFYGDKIIIDKGLIDNIKEGSAVINTYGIVGQIEKVNNNCSYVILISNKKHSIPIKIKKKDIFAIAKGSGYNKDLELEPLLMNIYLNKINIGDEVLSSGLDSKFPKNYPIGSISSIKINKNKNYIMCKIEPYIHSKNINEFLAIVKF